MTKNHWQNQYQIIESASKFHNKVREIFINDRYFSSMNCYQEINVKDLIPDYQFHNHHYDWYIEELNLILELHGQQHYKVVNYGNIGYDEAERAFIKIQERDNLKRLAAIDNNFNYKEISYKHKKELDAELLKELIFYG